MQNVTQMNLKEKSETQRCFVIFFERNVLHEKELLPGFEPGLLRPQRNVLTAIRSRPMALVIRIAGAGCIKLLITSLITIL